MTRQIGPSKKGQVGVPYRPTPEDEEMVQAMRINGLREYEIAKAMQIDKKTLAKHYRHIMAHGPAKVAARVYARLYRAAMGGDVRACIWLLERMDAAPAFQPQGAPPVPGAPVPVVFELPATDWEVKDGGPARHLSGPAQD